MEKSFTQEAIGTTQEQTVEMNRSEIMYFYPGYTSITKITLQNNRAMSISLGDEKKTLINL